MAGRSDVYLWCEDHQKKFIGKANRLLKTGDVVRSTRDDRYYKVEASTCGIAIVKEVER